ncbi:hypothetical protein ACSQ67_002703 [Phaseolus vulgaris]
MAEKHGPIFTIKLGSYKVLVLSSWEIAKECFTVHDKAFSTRPCVAASKLMGCKTVPCLACSLWSLLASCNKISLQVMVKKRLSKGRGFGRYEEVVWGFNSDIVLRMVRGKPNYRASDDYAEGEARRYKKTMRDFMSLFGIHRDGRVWSDPHEFKPGRFLTSHRDVDVKGQNSEFIPFGKIVTLFQCCFTFKPSCGHDREHWTHKFKSHPTQSSPNSTSRNQTL